MKLLISVRSPAEVGPALAGGADIIDAKEPARGPLGPVAPDILADILGRVPDDRPCSVALGDLATKEEVISAVGLVRSHRRTAGLYLKVGFAGVSSPAVARRLLEYAVAAASRHPGAPRIVAVAYADRSGSFHPHDLAQPAAQAGAVGVLLDTHRKDGQGLFGSMAPAEVATWVLGVQRCGMFAAVAGEIGMTDIETVQSLGADIVGVRGAACEGGREGSVAAERVMSLRLRIAPAGFGLSSTGGRARW